MKLKAFAGLAALALLATGAQAQSIELTLGSPVGPQDPATAQMEEYAARVAEASGGDIAIEVLSIETVGLQNVDTLRALTQGVVDLMSVSPYYVTRDEPLMGVFAPPGVFITPEDNLKILDIQAEIGAEILSENWGIVQYARSAGGGLRDLILISKEPINTLDQLREVRLRDATQAGVTAFNSLGVSTQIIPSSELYLALRTGVVDAALYIPTFVRTQSLQEVTCCMAFFSAFPIAYPFSYSALQTTWDELPEEARRILADVAEEMAAEDYAQWLAAPAEEAAYEWLTTEGGMTRLDPMPIEDRRTIRAAYIEGWNATCAELGERAIGYCERIQSVLLAD